MPGKNRNWWFILYPESAPEDWMDQLSIEMVPCAVSPLHDSDRKSDGTLKKAHYHILLRYDGPTTYKHVLELTRRYNATIPLIPNSPSAAYDYLTHSNHPDKAQYSISDIKHLNGFKPPKQDDSYDGVFTMRKKIIELILDNSLYEYSDLICSLVEHGLERELKEVVKNAYFYCSFIRSLAYKQSTKG